MRRGSRRWLSVIPHLRNEMWGTILFRVVKELLVAERPHMLSKGSALLASGRQVGQAGRAAEVAVEIAGRLQATRTESLFGEVGGFIQA